MSRWNCVRRDGATVIPRSEVHDTDLSDITTGEAIGPVTPGEVLLEEFMRPLGVSARALGRDIGVPHNQILEILKGERAVTAETALRLGRRFGTTAEFWMNFQAAHELDVARGRSQASASRVTHPPTR